MDCGSHKLLGGKRIAEKVDVILPPSNDCAWEIQDVYKKYSKPSIPIGKLRVQQNRSIFPRSSVFEYSKINTVEGVMDTDKTITHREQFQQNYEVTKPYQYSPANKLKLNCQPHHRSATLNPYSYPPIQSWQPQPQFWYNVESAFKGPTWPVGNPDDYRFQPLPFPSPEPGQLKEAIEIERPERYIPGEIYKNKIPKEPVQEFQGTGDCPTVWEPKHPEVFYAKFDESTLPTQPLLADDVKEEEAKLRKLIIKDNCPRFDEKSYTKPETFTSEKPQLAEPAQQKKIKVSFEQSPEGNTRKLEKLMPANMVETCCKMNNTGMKSIPTTNNERQPRKSDTRNITGCAKRCCK